MSYKNIVITKKLLSYTSVLTLLLLYTTPSQALSFQSPLIEGQLVYGQLDKGERLSIDSEFLRVGRTTPKRTMIATTTEGRFVLGIPQDATKLTLYLSKNGKTSPQIFSVQSRQWKEDVVNGLPKSKVTPPKKIIKKIHKEFAIMQRQRQKSTFHQFPDQWIKPLPQYKRISSPFGARRILNNIKKQGHTGTDYAADIGTPILAIRPGIVKLVHSNMYFSGKTILIDHGFGIFSSYSHLSKIFVVENQLVNQGDVIGEVGQTGRATGPHLHLGISWYNVRVDPEVLF